MNDRPPRFSRILSNAPGAWQHRGNAQLPGRRGSHSHAKGGALSLCHGDEWRLDVHPGRSEGVDDLQHERRRDVPWAQVDDPDKGCSDAYCRTAKGQVVGEDDTPLCGGAFEYFDVRPANQLFILCGSKVETSGAQTNDDVGSDVFVCQQREVERRHAVIFSSQVCSPFSASAAHRKAALRPSDVS